MDRDEPLDTVLRRATLLGVLVDGPVDKRSLVDALDVSRSTVDRAVRELESLGLVTRERGQFVATLAGRLVHRAVEEYRDRTGAVLRASDLLVHLDPDCGIDARLLDGASLYAAEGPAPYRSAERLEDLFEDAGRVHAFVRAITDARSSHVVREAVLAGTTYEAIYAADVAEFVRETHAEDRREMVASNNYWAFETDELPFGLFIAYETDPRPGRPGLPDGAASVTRSAGGTTATGNSARIDDAPGRAEAGEPDEADESGGTGATATAPATPAATVGVAVYDRRTDLRGVVLNDSPAAVAWAEATYRSYRAAATELTDEFRTDT